MVEAPRQQQLCGAAAQVSVHKLGSSLAAEMEHLFPDAPRERSFLAVITFQFPAGGIDLAPGPKAGTNPQACSSQRHRPQPAGRPVL